MFATICAYCHPSDPLAIWNNFKEFMIEDLLLNHNLDVAINSIVYEIVKELVFLYQLFHN